MKKFIKNNIFGFILGIILCSGIVYAASYYAKDISYEPTDASWEVNNVSEALNDLHTLVGAASKSNIYKLGTGRSFNISSIVGIENVGNYTKDNFIAVPDGSSVNSSPMQTVGSRDNPSATAALSSGTITYDASTGTVTVSGFVLTATQYAYQYGQGPMGSNATNLAVTVYFVVGV